MDRLKNKRALVTGGSSGIGLETARQFLAEGAHVAIAGGDQATLDKARKELGDVLAIRADAGDVKSQRVVADAIREGFGALDIVFINAGIGDFRPLEQWDEEGFDRSFAVNLKGPFFLVQALLPVFAKPATIVLNTSINAHLGMPNSSIYAATKAGLLSLARTLSGELLPRGIRVNAVSPGPIATPFHAKLGMGETQITDLVAQIPAGRRGRPEELAKAVVFLASDEAAFTVGSELIVDGGMSTL
jgi:NAD(P)-dependent dehydrogenase (short-subunit alcohol dehydrogenase family)